MQILTFWSPRSTVLLYTCSSSLVTRRFGWRMWKILANFWFKQHRILTLPKMIGWCCTVYQICCILLLQDLIWIWKSCKTRILDGFPVMSLRGMRSSGKMFCRTAPRSRTSATWWRGTYRTWTSTCRFYAQVYHRNTSGWFALLHLSEHVAFWCAGTWPRLDRGWPRSVDAIGLWPRTWPRLEGKYSKEEESLDRAWPRACKRGRLGRFCWPRWPRRPRSQKWVWPRTLEGKRQKTDSFWIRHVLKTPYLSELVLVLVRSCFGFQAKLDVASTSLLITYGVENRWGTNTGVFWGTDLCVQALWTWLCWRWRPLTRAAIHLWAVQHCGADFAP